MDAVTAEWHGTTAEGNAFVQAIARYCQCDWGLMGMRTSTCKLHEAMLSDQSWLDHLVFAYRLRARWLAGEEATS